MPAHQKNKEFYTAVWCVKDEASFRESIPFELLGESMQKYQSSFPIKIVVLEGYDKLSHPYLKKLESLGFELLNYGDRYQKIIERFPNIGRHFSRYERNCFLRWIAFKDIIDKKPELEQFWHLDSDIILHTSLDELARDTAGKTFMLEGCPVLVSVSDFNWFKTYETELSAFENDIIGYSNKAAEQKNFCKKNDTLLCNQSLYRNPLGSDQDFLEYLVSSQTIKQNTSSVIFGSSFHFVQNPLVFSFWDDLQNQKNTKTFAREEANGEIRYGNKRIPFTHFQNTFCYTANIYIFLARLGLMKISVVRKLIGFKKGFHPTLASKIVSRITTILKVRKKRGEIIRFLLRYNKKTKQPHLVELINFLNEKSTEEQGPGDYNEKINMKCKICQKTAESIFNATILAEFKTDYFRCPNCEAVQTNEPTWLNRAYSDAITSQDTGLVSRNIACGRLALWVINRCFDKHKQFLDYAGGYGILVRLMRDSGLNFFWYDKYCKNLFAQGYGVLKPVKESGAYELLTAFEVFEHLPNPMPEIESMFQSADSILFSTTLIPKNKKIDATWNYLGLEHGQHVFFYSEKTLESIAKKFHKNLYSDGKNFHLITSKKFLINPLRLYSVLPTVIYRRIWNKLATFGLWKPIPRMNHYELRHFKV